MIFGTGGMALEINKLETISITRKTNDHEKIFYPFTKHTILTFSPGF